MKNENCGFLSKAIAVAALTAGGATLSTFAAAQSDATSSYSSRGDTALRDSVRAAYEASATVATNIPGIYRFNAPPDGFNPLTASDEENATYGFPPRPDKETDARGFEMWTRAIGNSTTRWSGELKHTGAYSKPAHPVRASATHETAYYDNWSGIISTNTLTKYNTSTSFSRIYSTFNVPAVKQPTGSCDGGWDWEVSWNGIDGNQDQNALLQGGSSSKAYCIGKTTKTSYFAWIEWWPAYDILEEFSVNPGDEMYVYTWNTSATQGYVYLDDQTTGQYATYSLTPNGGAGLIGNSAEYIVERPGGDGSGLYPLPNYTSDTWTNSYAYDFAGTEFYPGSTSSSTVITYMEDDQGNQVISSPTVQGNTGIYFVPEGCAVSGGCKR